MKRILTGIVLAALMAASQATATSLPMLRGMERASSDTMTSNGFLGLDADTGGLVLFLGLSIIIAVAINANNNDSPSSP